MIIAADIYCLGNFIRMIMAATDIYGLGYNTGMIIPTDIYCLGSTTGLIMAINIYWEVLLVWLSPYRTITGEFDFFEGERGGKGASIHKF